MKWIKHDTDANQDNKLQNVLLDYGLEGYGLYWYCLELIGSKVDKDKLTFELEHDARVIARNVGSSAQRVEEMMRYFVNQGLFECADNTITCLAMAKRLDKSMTSNPEMRKLIANLNQNSTVKEGYVYAIVGEREGSSAEIKIGRSANPHSRFKEHQKKYSEFGYSLELIGTIKSDDCISLETEIHRKLKDFQVRKEWFYLTEDVQKILRHDYGLTTTCKTRLDKTRLEENRKTLGSSDDKPAEKPVKQKQEYPAEFEHLWSQIPQRIGTNPKRKAYQAYTARLKANATHDEMLAGLLRYKKHLEEQQKLNTPFVMQIATFFGPDEHFKEQWTFNNPQQQQQTRKINDL